jgi:hypothetical protein
MKNGTLHTLFIVYDEFHFVPTQRKFSNIIMTSTEATPKVGYRIINRGLKYRKWDILQAFGVGFAARR